MSLSPEKYATRIKGYEHYQEADPVQKLVDDWIEKRIHTCKPSTICTYRALFNPIIRFFKRKPVQEWNQQDGVRLIDHLVNKLQLNPNVVRFKMRFLQFVLNDAEDEGLIPRQPWNRRKLPRVRPAKIEKMPFTHELFLKVQDEMRKEKYAKWWPDACAIAWHTGMRMGDVATSRKSSVNLRDGVYTNYTMKKSAGREVLEIPIEPELRPVLERLLLAETELNVTDNLMPGMCWTYLNQRQIMIRDFRRACDACGLPRYSFHSFRHSYVTRLLNAGVDSIVISALTGQSITQIQEYSHVSLAAKFAALARSRGEQSVKVIEL